MNTLNDVAFGAVTLGAGSAVLSTIELTQARIAGGISEAEYHKELSGIAGDFFGGLVGAWLAGKAGEVLGKAAGKVGRATGALVSEGLSRVKSGLKGLVREGAAIGRDFSRGFGEKLGEGLRERMGELSGADLGMHTLAEAIGEGIERASEGFTTRAIQRTIDSPDGLRRLAMRVHELSGKERAVQMSAIAINEVRLSNGERTFYASGSGGRLNSKQRVLLEKYGVPTENIFLGKNIQKASLSLKIMRRELF